MTKSADPVQKELLELSDEALQGLKFSMPWNYMDGEYSDPDGFSVSRTEAKEDTPNTREALQGECWRKFHDSPQVNTAVRGLQGRMAGMGFETTSGELDLQEAIEQIELDYRNRLYTFWPKYIGRSLLEGELYNMFTVHPDGFIEVDFIDPMTIKGAGDDSSGIIFHPFKTLMPLVYTIKNGDETYQIPSIFIARNPELINIARRHNDFKSKYFKASRSRKKVYAPFKGYFRFIVGWNKDLLTKRAVSYLRTTLVWLNHYENLKKYEIDHKKASGAYVWTFKIEDATMFKLWLSLTDDQRRKTGILAKKTPGGTMILPPGVSLEVVNPSLSPIKEQDTDILEMIGSGLNEEEGTMMGSSRSTFASAKATRGPMSDRVSDEIAWFERFARFDFWDSIFYLKSQVTDFPYKKKVKEVVGFKAVKEKNESTGREEWVHKEVFKDRTYLCSQLIDIQFPISETIDFESHAKGLLGSKHGPVSESLGISNETIAKRMGFGGYPRHRLRKATEAYNFPRLIYSFDAESLQEKVEGEPKGASQANEEQGK